MAVVVGREAPGGVKTETDDMTMAMTRTTTARLRRRLFFFCIAVDIMCEVCKLRLERGSVCQIMF